jgi:GTPase SAR1 family protein
MEELGRFFEVGFNIGILAEIERRNLRHPFGSCYRQELASLRLSKIVRRIVKKYEAIAPQNVAIVTQWTQFFLLKGFVSGLNFLREYLKATNWKKRQLEQVEILYYQCNFGNDNTVGTSQKSERDRIRDYFAQLGMGEESDRLTLQYKGKGQFLQADTLLWLRHRQKHRIVCVDLSVFSVKSAADLVPLDEIEMLRQLLATEIKYLRSKSVFSKLRIDTGQQEDFDLHFSQDLMRYFTAFKRKDKESAKLIQAGSYAYSFYQFLQQFGRLKDAKSLILNVVGYSDRQISNLSISLDNIDLLKTCAYIYKNEPSNAQIQETRHQVLEIVRRNAAKSFENGTHLVNQLLDILSNHSANGISQVVHQEHLDNFVNSIGIVDDDLADRLQVERGSQLRSAHAQLIEKALNSDDIYLFLTGNPGIGKTTAIANFLKQHFDEGFLFLYISPRKQVNLDILEKFKDKTGNLCDDRLFCITSNSVIIKENNGLKTVLYHANKSQNHFTLNTVNFIPINDRNTNSKKSERPTSLEQTRQDTIRSLKNRSSGVLQSLCEALNGIVTQEISNHTIATVAIQSLRMTGEESSTLTHLDRIFASAYNSREERVIPEKMAAISRRIKHLFIAIDEITGDDSGVSFFKGIREFINKFNLAEYGFNLKIIVADASIVDSQVIEQHLSDSSPELDKIYVRRTKSDIEPLSVKEFNFHRNKARSINTNSYPASSLDFTYKVFLETIEFSQNPFKYDANNALVSSIQERIFKDICNLLDREGSAQILVYIQDKRRLQELIEQLKNQRKQFQYCSDYLEIHANLSDPEKSLIQQYKQDAKVIFMTSSASRGLSFPKARHILVDIPQFQIERNLMEVIQVIYRARGNYWENEELKTLDNLSKEIIFYLGDRAIYYPGTSESYSEEEMKLSKAFSRQESLLNILNILLVLKVSILTRIVGAGRLGRKKDYSIIPIGGKSVSASGMTFTDRMANLIRQLKNEHRRLPSHQQLKRVYTSLEKLLDRAEFVLDKRSQQDFQETYLSLKNSFFSKFVEACHRFDRLLDLKDIETGYLNGNLLVVPISNRRLEESYTIALETQIKQYATPDLIEDMRAIGRNQQYPENLQAAIEDGALELIELLEGERSQSQYLELNSAESDRYYAIPLFAFVSSETLRDYFKNYPRDLEDHRRFRSLLSSYVRCLYPVYNTLPIGYKYEEFPFLIFRSYSLEQIRYKMFADRYLLRSHELNVLNLILAKE